VSTALGGEEQGIPAPSMSTLDQQAVTSVQSAAKWVVAAFAAVGAILVTDLQIGGIGELSAEQPRRLVLALGAMTSALLAVAVVLILASLVLIPPRVSLSELSKRELEAYKKSLRAAGGDPAKARSPAAFDPVLGAISAEQAWLLRSNASGVQDLYDKWKKAQGGPSQDADLIDQDARRVIDFASLKVTQARYSRLVVGIFAGGSVIVLCIVLFAWAANPPKPVEEARITQPIQVLVVFTASPESLRRAGISPACAGQELSAVAVAGKLQEPEVVTQGASKCPPSRFVVRRDLGLAIPVLSRSP
jgi:hypothetical protein